MHYNMHYNICIIYAWFFFLQVVHKQTNFCAATSADDDEPVSKHQCLGIQHGSGDSVSASSLDSGESSHDNPWHWSPLSRFSSDENVTEDETVTLCSVPDTLQTVSTTPEEELLQRIPSVTIHREDDDDQILWSPLPDNLPSEQEQLQPATAAATANLLDLADQHQE